MDTLSLDGIYNNLNIYEPEVKGTSSSSTNTQNVAFVSSNSTNSTNGAVNTAHCATTASTQATAVNSTTIDNLIDVVICDRFKVADGYANNEGKEILEEHWKEVFCECGGGLILYQAYGNLYAMTGRKAYLLEDKQIPSVGVFDEEAKSKLLEAATLYAHIGDLFSLATAFVIFQKNNEEDILQPNHRLQATNIILQGLPTEVYALVSNHKVTKELWERIQLLMQGTSLTKQERECKLYDEFDNLAYKKGETLLNTKFLNTLPLERSKFVTDVKLVGDLHTTNIDQLHAYLGQHEFHVNEVRLMHERNSDPLALVATH
ncbi:hypothetical protein Tco_0646077 [Tanacetum coccineum]